MTAPTVWLVIFACLYGAGCLYWASAGARRTRSATDFAVAGAQLPGWAFALAVTAASLGGWAVLQQAGAVNRYGLPFATVGLAVIAIPLTAALVFKRQWLAARHLQAVTPAQVLAAYYRSPAVGVLTVLVAVLAALTLLVVQVRASGLLVAVVTGGAIPAPVAMVALALLLLGYAAWGGLRGVAYAGAAQCGLMAAGLVGMGAVALHLTGGWSGLADGLASLAAAPTDRAGATLAVPAVLAPDANWPAVTIATYVLALCGIACAPNMSVWVLASASLRPFAVQQVWLSGVLFGPLVVVMVTLIGLSGHTIATGPDAADEPNAITGLIIARAGAFAPWLVGFLAVCVLAALQAAAGAFAVTAGSMLAHDLPTLAGRRPAAGTASLRIARLCVALLILAALVIAFVCRQDLVGLAGMAFAFALQMAPALLGLCYLSWLTRAGIAAGLLAGLAIVAATDIPGQVLGLPAAFRWPFGLHSGFWALLANLGLAVALSALTRKPDSRAGRLAVHAALSNHAAPAAGKRHLVPLAWAAVLVWTVFAVGPGLVLGNAVFGAPHAPESWTFGLPSLWLWQWLWWAAGALLLWWLAYRLGLSTVPASGGDDPAPPTEG